MRIEQRRSQLERYEALCQEIGEEPAVVALAWLLENSAVTAPIIGPRTKDQLTTSLRALELSLSGETNQRLDEIWPGPGGEAPQAYAWSQLGGVTWTFTKHTGRLPNSARSPKHRLM